MFSSSVRYIQKQAPKLLEINNIVFIVAIGIALSLIWNTVTAIEKNFELQTRVDSLADEVALLELENENLDLNNDYFNSDAYLELAARETLGLVKPGEKVLVLPDYSELEVEAETEAQQEDVAQTKVSNVDQWLYFLFRREP